MLAKGMSAFIERAPEYAVRNGHVFITLDCGVEIVMPVSECVIAMGRCRSALDDWFESQRPKVIQMRASH